MMNREGGCKNYFNILPQFLPGRTEWNKKHVGTASNLGPPNMKQDCYHLASLHLSPKVYAHSHHKRIS